MWPEIRQILKGGLCAALIWVLLVMALIGWMIQSRWDSPTNYEYFLQKQELNKKLAEARQAGGETTIPWWLKREDELVDTVAQLKDLQRTQKATGLEYGQVRDSVQELAKGVEVLNAELLSNVGEKVSLVNLKRLLSMDSLSHADSLVFLKSIFNKATKELTEASERNAKVNWEHIHETLTMDFPEKEADETDYRHCSSEEVGQTKSTSQVPKNAARHSDLEQRVSKIEDMLTRRTGSNGVAEMLLPASVRAMEKDAQRQVEQALDELMQAAEEAKASAKAESSNSSGSCVDEAKLIEIVEAGLLALQRHGDLREALRNKAMELDPQAESIILDADMKVPQPKVPEQDTINLQRVLDTPIVNNLAGSIDKLVELCGGYNDKFDSWVDSMAGQKTVGETVVQQLLDGAGHLEVPHPQRLVKDYFPEKKEQ